MVKNKDKTKELLTLLKEVNDLVWDGKWDGDIDPTALKERIDDLLCCERSLDEQNEQLLLVRKFLSNSSRDRHGDDF